MNGVDQRSRKPALLEETMAPYRKNRPYLAVTLAASTILSLAATHQAAATPAYGYLTSITVPGAATFSGYDLSAFDPTNQLYYLTDRTNKGIDVFSAATNSYVERIGAGLFAGSQGGNNDIAGPNGIYLSNTSTGKLLLAGDGTSRVFAFNLDSSGQNVVGAPRTTSTAVPGTTPAIPNRVDGVAYAPAANTILAANNASNPGFITLIDNASGNVLRTIKLDGTGGYPSVAGNGVEATIYNTARNSFFVAVPTLSVNPDGSAADGGGLIELDAKTGNLLNTFNFNTLGATGACSPTGLAQGAGASMFVACSDPTAGRSLLVDPTGAGSLRFANGISGGDQVSYDPTNNSFFEAARFQTGGPVLGIIDAVTLALQTIAIGVNDHAVSVDPISNEVFVATAPTTAIPGCTAGCIAVFTPVPEPATWSIMTVALLALGLLGWKRRAF